MTAAVRSASTKVPNLAAGTAVALTRLGARSRLTALSTVVVTTYPSSPTMAMSGIATRKYIRSLMDRPRDPMDPSLFKRVDAGGPPPHPTNGQDGQNSP